VNVPADRTLEASFTDLDNGRAYTVWVRAQNKIGLGPETASGPVTPCRAPFPPLGVAAEMRLTSIMNAGSRVHDRSSKRSDGSLVWVTASRGEVTVEAARDRRERISRQ